MEWKDILHNKRQTFLWADTIPDRSVINTILDELHRYCNSKQNEVPYRIEVLDWSDKDRRIEIFQDSWCGEDTIDDRRNPQLLAPYLFLFYRRTVFDDPDEQNYHHLEVGFASQFIAMSAVNHGLDVGFCACNHSDEILLSLGIGYGDTSRKKGKYLNPLTNKMSYLNESEPPKPDKDIYIQFD